MRRFFRVARKIILAPVLIYLWLLGWLLVFAGTRSEGNNGEE
jgi:hypothetical protein